ncbi:hypothetical protein PV328_005318 [Microctonus aethiopoides]|uniref:Solute carrier family 66 member 2 n=1 Tax=Microctonus aethiopoides TaxID=144406 RepID=A0AA39FLP8_9HYME|nr:hypothetical protein PV328_005318 [Microctonus aethiopoides]
MLESYEDLTIKDVVSAIASGAIIFGGIVPYIPQYREIKRTQDSTGFSLYVCLAILIANTLRILYWFGKYYELPLLFQSILMIIAMFAMIRLCINANNRNQIIKAKDQVFTDFNSKYFWKWTDFQSYVQFMLVFGTIGGIIMYIFVNNIIFVEITGLLSVLIEGMLGLPQLILNFNNGSTEGMSISMVVMWTMGDVFKTIYFVYRKAPIQFAICGSMQIFIDIIILIQECYYRIFSPPRLYGTRKE